MSIDEAATAKGRLAAPIAAGIDALSQNQAITFTPYTKTILPVDGYVFWVKSAGSVLTVKGSLHYATERRQGEDETLDRNKIVFTSEREVQALNEIAPTTLYVGEFDGQKFAWSSRGSFYRQADTYHYVGDAVYPALATQLVDSADDVPAGQIVTNSLPFWLAMNSFVQQPWDYFGNQGITLYPSFLVDENIPPPYGAVHVMPEGTQALAAAPSLGATLTHSQLSQDRVRITLYGLTNDQALSFVDFVNQQSLSSGQFGIVNIPSIRDDKRTQSELAVIAMKKTVEFDITYQQVSARDVARQLIEHAVVTYQPAAA